MPTIPGIGESSESRDIGGTKPLRRVKRWYSAAAVGLLNVVLLLLLLNLAVYFTLRTRVPAKSEAPQISFDPVRLHKAYPGWREDDVRTLLLETLREKEYEPFTGFREAPFQGRFVHIEPGGFRLSKDQAPWPPVTAAINVFVFGGSTAFGASLPDDQTIASYLQEAAIEDRASPPLAIYNFARPAYFSSQELVLFEQLLRAGFVPQVAVFIDGLNDFIFADGRPLFADRLADFMAGRVGSESFDYLPMMRAAHLLSERRAQPKAQEPLSYDDPVLLQGVVDRWLANKRMIELISSGFGVRPIFVWQPVPVYKYDLRYHFFLHSSTEFAAYGRSGYGYPLMEALRAQGKLGYDVLWLADMQQDKHENLYVDSIHYNATFSKEIAAQIYGFLRQSGANGGLGQSARVHDALAKRPAQQRRQISR